MPNFSQIVVAGHLGRDAELKTVGSTQLTAFSIAVTRRRKDTEQTTWFNCQWWGSHAAKVQQYLAKGKAVLVSGELFEREYTTSAGEKKKSLEIDVNDVVLLGSREDSAAAPAPSRPAAAKAAAGADDEAPF